MMILLLKKPKVKISDYIDNKEAYSFIEFHVSSDTLRFKNITLNNPSATPQ